jgi:hypothetical protein
VGLVCADQLGDGAWDTRIGRGPEEEAADRGSERAGRQVESVAAKERRRIDGSDSEKPMTGLSVAEGSADVGACRQDSLQ